ncbi:MAG: dTMP kinase [Planctomycetota bacterium]
MQQKLKGKFVVIDGPDGCGKTTQVTLLAKWARERSIDTVSFRDPGTTPIGERIRQILLDPSNTAMCIRTELLLYMAARAQLLSEQIEPSLKAGRFVILDRWLSSTCAYQGFAGEFGERNVLDVAEHTLQRIWPDLTFILDVDLNTSKGRLKDNRDRMEQKSLAYCQKVRQGFLNFAGNRDNVVIVEAKAAIQDVHATIIRELTRRICNVD